jgi:hypothetical protein
MEFKEKIGKIILKKFVKEFWVLMDNVYLLAHENN